MHAVPTVAPNTTAAWTNNTELRVSWTRLTLEEAHGFVIAYIITYNVQEGKRRREANSMSVGSDETMVTIGGLQPEKDFSISVAAQTAAGIGVGSTPLLIPSEYNPIIRIIGLCFYMVCALVFCCREWISFPTAFAECIKL